MDVRISTVALKNFKCYTDAEIHFAGRDAYISGQNGEGKSTIFDAIIWCFTGKLPNAKADGASIRPIGQPVEVVPEVEVEAIVDGAATLFNRKLEPTYTGRGADKAYKGDMTVCTIDGVPKSATDYNAYVSQIFPINATVWLDLLAFADDTKFSADDRRKVLVDAFGQITDESVKMLNPDFDELFVNKGKLSVEDYKTAMKEQEKSCTTELGRGKTQGTLQARIDEAMKAITHPELSVASQEKAIADLEEQIKTATSGNDDGLKALLAGTQSQLAIVNSKIDADIAAKKTALYAKVDTESIALNGKISVARTAKLKAESDADNANNIIRDCDRYITNLMADRAEFEAKVPNITTVCPTCGQPIPKEQIDEAIGNFNESKAKALEDYDNKIKSYVEKKATHEAIKADVLKAADKAQKKLSALQDEFNKLNEERNMLANIEVEPDAELLGQRIALENEIASLKTEVQMAGTSEKVADLTIQLKAEQSKLAEAQANARQIARIAELKNRQKEVVEMLSKAQRMIALCDEFITTRARFIEQSIAQHFDGVTFKLFDVFKNGEIKNACVPIMDGKPFALLSFSQKTVASVAILNGLSKHFGFTAPCLIDNASEMDSNTISKLATAGQKIIIKVDNSIFTYEVL